MVPQPLGQRVTLGSGVAASSGASPGCTRQLSKHLCGGQVLHAVPERGALGGAGIVVIAPLAVWSCLQAMGGGSEHESLDMSREFSRAKELRLLVWGEEQIKAEDSILAGPF